LDKGRLNAEWTDKLLGLLWNAIRHFLRSGLLQCGLACVNDRLEGYWLWINTKTSYCLFLRTKREKQYTCVLESLPGGVWCCFLVQCILFLPSIRMQHLTDHLKAVGRPEGDSLLVATNCSFRMTSVLKWVQVKSTHHIQAASVHTRIIYAVTFTTRSGFLSWSNPIKIFTVDALRVELLTFDIDVSEQWHPSDLVRCWMHKWKRKSAPHQETASQANDE